MIGSNLFCSQGQALRMGSEVQLGTTAWIRGVSFGNLVVAKLWIDDSIAPRGSSQVGFRASLPDLRNLTVMQNREVKQLKSRESLHCSLSCEAFEQTFCCACFRVLSIKSRFNCSRQKFASPWTNRRFAVFPQNNVRYFLCFPQEISSEAILSRNCD